MAGKREYPVLLIPLLFVDVRPLIVERVNGGDAVCAPTSPDCILDVGAPFVDSFPRPDEQIVRGFWLGTHIWA